MDSLSVARLYATQLDQKFSSKGFQHINFLFRSALSLLNFFTTHTHSYFSTSTGFLFITKYCSKWLL